MSSSAGPIAPCTTPSARPRWHPPSAPGKSPLEASPPESSQAEGTGPDPDEPQPGEEQLVGDQEVEGEGDAEHQQEAPVPTPVGYSAHGAPGLSMLRP